jgi:hypothetical protein
MHMTNTDTQTFTTYAVEYWVEGHGADAETRYLNVIVPSSQGVTQVTLPAVLRQTCAQEAGCVDHGMVEVTRWERIDGGES